MLVLQKVYGPQSKLILYVALALCCSDTIFLGSRHGPFPAVFTHQVSSIVESQGYPSNVSPQVHVSAALTQPQPPPPHQGQPGLEVHTLHTETAEAAAGGGKNVPLYMDRLDEALRGAENGQKIFIEAGVYMHGDGEPGWLLALRVREERVPGGRQHEGLRSAIPEHEDPGPRPGQPQHHQD